MDMSIIFLDKNYELSYTCTHTHTVEALRILIVAYKLNFYTFSTSLLLFGPFLCYLLNSKIWDSVQLLHYLTVS